MALCGEVHYDIGMLLLKQRINRLAIADIRLHKAEIGILHHRLQRGKIARISQFIQANDSIIGIFLEHMEDKVTSDKSGTAGYNDRHIFGPFGSLNIGIFRRQHFSDVRRRGIYRTSLPIAKVFPC